MANLQRQLQGHPHIVKLVCAASQLSEDDDKSTNSFDEVLLLMELCSGGHLIDLINGHRDVESLKPHVVVLIFIQCCKAVAHMHNQAPPVIHRDLKPENFLLNSNNIMRLCDFGSSTKSTFQPTESWTSQDRALLLEDIEEVTTPLYRPPEMIDLWSNQEINEKVDVWDLGCLLYILCYSSHPFEDTSSTGSTKLAILNAKYNIPKNKPDYKLFENLIRKILVVNVNQRPSVSDILNDLNEISNELKLNLDIGATWSIPIEASATSVTPNEHGQAANDSYVGTNVTSKGTAFLGMLKSVSNSVTNTMQSLYTNKLDVTYITTKLIVMPFPSIRGHESTRQNPIEEVRNFLERSHPQSYHVFNVSPKMYDTTVLNSAVTHFCTPSRRLLSLNHLFAVCRAIDSWLSKDSKNVAIIHCKDGKSTSVLVTACYLVYCGLFKTGETTLRMVLAKRSQDVDVIEISPSQRRFLRYFSTIVNKGKSSLHEHTVRLDSISITPVPLFNKARIGCRPYIEVFENNTRRVCTFQDALEEMRVYNSSDGKIMFPLGTLVRGDVMIAVYHARSTLSSKIHRELDHIDEDNPDKYPSGFHVELAVSVLKTHQGPTDMDDDSDDEPDPILPPDATHLQERVILFPCLSSKKELETIRLQYGQMDTISYEKLEKLDNARTEALQRKQSADSISAIRDTSGLSKSSSNPGNILDLTSDAVNRADEAEERFLNRAKVVVNVEQETTKTEDTLLDFSSSNVTAAPSHQSVSNDKFLQKSPPVKLVSPSSEVNLINLEISQKSQGMHRSKSADRISELVNQSPISPTDPFSSFFDNKLPTKAVSSDSFDPFAPTVKASNNALKKPETNPTGAVQLDAFDPFSQNNNKSVSGKDDLISISPRAKDSPDVFDFATQRAPSPSAQRTHSPESIIFDPFGATGDTNQRRTPELLQPSSTSNQPIIKPQKRESDNKKQGFRSNLESLAQGKFDLNLNQTNNIGNKQPMAAQKPTQKSPIGNLPTGQRASYVIGSREERGLRGSIGVKPNVAKNEFSDLLGAQGFIPKAHDKGHVTINEMRREEVEKTTDPIKLKIQDWVGGQKGNIRALLCSLHTAVWEGCKWKEIGMHQVIESNNVKKYYRKACLCIHPDKVVGEPHEKLARAIFVELNEAWTEFEQSGAKPLF
ncbi:uncharacterized protein TRIADDRAFT_57838 [Trichoplax adhaerens]|uniref:Protein kinase domain-containing protein n=1 Tax=Trichoplax adhaerens TaxID=10228 RepID=B3S1P7_TRIAD|nr:hypothetical protein TRIADDRAFT_57838 [Trichoplax adhaerens]EDV23330.1 hypothetical protein TRIADDRAFT_57838 [Trichoplax adhaerens]|eukprot:XP_002114240.1 hypothetical protein TRIADDRAFT_57838 [Trichoplax adhaerens]